VLAHDAPFHSAFGAEVFVHKCNVISEMKLQFTVNGIRQLLVVVVLVVITGCGASNRGENDFEPDPVVNQNPTVGTTEMVGTNCRAEVIADANGMKHYKSTYFSIFSDGSEQVQNMVETETPCP
jgi:hypothetical protein